MSTETDSKMPTKSDIIREQFNSTLSLYTPESKMKGHSLGVLIVSLQSALAEEKSITDISMWEELRDKTLLAQTQAEKIEDNFSSSLFKVLLEGYNTIIEKNFE